jgi:DNA modification methylase
MLDFHKKTIYEALGREPVHPFPARMAPGIALQVMSETNAEVRVLDPMMGSGTVLAMARSKGHRAIGFDIDPLAVLISKVWTTAIDPKDVRDQANNVLEAAFTEFKNITVGDAYPELADEETRGFIRYWFDGYARRQLTALSLAIGFLECETTRNALWCAFSRLIISKQSGASRAMDLSHSRPHRAFDTAPGKPFNKFKLAVERVIANAIDKKSPGRGPQPTIGVGDARELALPDQSVDLVLTSPPYLNAIDYIRCSKFSLVWIGYNIGNLRRVRTDSVGSEAAQQQGLDDDKEIKSIADALKLRPKLEKRHERILGRYIHDMRGAISQVARVLSTTGKAVYVVGENTLRGTYIRTSVIVSKLAELAGLSLKEQRTRSLPANRRYMPPPSSGHSGGAIEARMRREVVLTFVK